MSNASNRKKRRVVFNIKGNDYRVVVAVAYRHPAVYVKFVGTHASYEAIDPIEAINVRRNYRQPPDSLCVASACR